MGVVGPCFIAVLLFRHAYALCSNQYLNATTTSQLFSYKFYTNNEFCVINIAPSNFLNSSQFFLEIIWATFDIKGKLPDCKEDYVEVNLTRSGYGIGKFCSNNAIEKPFNMYSHDGFANLTFKSNNETTGDGFSFKYRLRNKTADPLVGDPLCNSIDDNSTNYFSNKWPSEYDGKSNSGCWLLIHLEERQNSRLSVMDLDFYSADRYPEERNFKCQEYIEVWESNYGPPPQVDFTSVSGTLCREPSHRYYIVKKQYFMFMAALRFASSSNRGFLIGYIRFNKDKVDDDQNDFYECTRGTHKCDPNANCINTVGSYDCYCRRGFTGNGALCIDFNECTGGTNRCDPNAICINTVGSYDCYCRRGFTGNGTLCIDKDECRIGTDSCRIGTICANTIGSYRCSCKSGYAWNGYFCSKDYLSDCTKCSVNADCISIRPRSLCVCKKGYSGNGTSCSLIGNGNFFSRDGSSSKASKTGTYIGGAVGAVALILIITIVISCWCKRSHHCRESIAATNPSQSQATISATYIVANACAEVSVMQKTEKLGSDNNP